MTVTSAPLLPVAIDPVIVTRRKDAMALPRRMAVVVARTGTLTAQRGIVMADEAMALAFGRGLLDSAGEHMESVDVVEPSGVDPEKHDGIFLFHHHIHFMLPKRCETIPCWLWVHNPGHSTTMGLARDGVSRYQRIFHAGLYRSTSRGLTYLPHGLEDIDLFRPHTGEPQYDVAFVGNGVMHRELVPFFHRINMSGRRLNLRGLGWIEAGLPSEGPIPMRDTGSVLARAKVCFDHVSDAHRDEGMISTRIFQCLACSVPVVTIQSPKVIPETLHKHIVFADDLDSALVQIERLLTDTITRARMRDGARASISGHTIKDRARQVWSTMIADISANKAKHGAT